MYVKKNRKERENFNRPWKKSLVVIMEEKIKKKEKGQFFRLAKSWLY